MKEKLSQEVFEGFEAVVREPESSGETIESRFVAIEGAEIARAECRSRVAQVTVRFTSKIVSVTRNSAGAVTEGSPDGATDISDTWTFARDVLSTDQSWKVVGTEAGA